MRGPASFLQVFVARTVVSSALGGAFRRSCLLVLALACVLALAAPVLAATSGAASAIVVPQLGR